MSYRVELTVFHDETTRSDWADVHVFSEHEYLPRAVVDVNAAFNRMVAPLKGTWELCVVNDETGERDVRYHNTSQSVEPSASSPSRRR